MPLLVIHLECSDVLRCRRTGYRNCRSVAFERQDSKRCGQTASGQNK